MASPIPIRVWSQIAADTLRGTQPTFAGPSDHNSWRVCAALPNAGLSVSLGLQASEEVIQHIAAGIMYAKVNPRKPAVQDGHQAGEHMETYAPHCVQSILDRSSKLKSE